MHPVLHLHRHAQQRPHAPALAWGAQVLQSHAELARCVAQLAQGLLGLGLQRGDRVALVMKNHPAYLQLMLAAWHAGLAAVPINSKLHPRELAHIFDDSQAAVVFATANTRTACDEGAGLAHAVRHVIEVGSAAFAALAAQPPLPFVLGDPADLAWLFYTSGTTGRPKGVMLSHRNLLACSHNYLADVDSIAPTDCIVHAAPMSHGSGLYILPHVARGAMNVVPESGGFEPSEIAALCQVHSGVTMFAAPTMVKRLVDAPHDMPLHGLKTMVYGGGPMYVADIQAAMARFGQRFAQIYGQGESPMTITVSPQSVHQDTQHPRYLQRLGSVGVPFGGVQVQVCGAQGQALPVGEVGDIAVRGDVVMQGYWRNPQASAQALLNGWLLTGDVGVLDADGFLTLKDRSKDLIISGGSNIYPREVEEVLQLHPGVAEVSVVGQAHAEWGEEVVAFVVLRAGHGRWPGGTAPPARNDSAGMAEGAVEGTVEGGRLAAPACAADLDALCLQHMARFKRPKHYRVVAELPKNEAGKVLKTTLRQWLQTPA